MFVFECSNLSVCVWLLGELETVLSVHCMLIGNICVLVCVCLCLGMCVSVFDSVVI